MTDQQREILLSVRNMDVCFGKKRKPFKAVNNVSFDIYKGETFGLVGESGSGKTTITNLINRFYDIQKGEILLDGINIKEINLRSLRNNIGIILQDPFIFAKSKQFLTHF